jgi:hypothetical protein
MTSEHVGWSAGPGVVQLPDGRTVRGRGLRRPIPPGPLPDLGVYLSSRRPPPTSWRQCWIPCRDFATPADRELAVASLRAAHHAAVRERVELGCSGGTGRTGMAMAVMAILSGVEADDAVDWVRRHYRVRAAETPWQRRWVRDIGGALHGGDVAP